MKNDQLYLEHIAEAISRIANYIADMDAPAFHSTPVVQDACIRQLEIIGEATKRLTTEFRNKHTHVPWKDIAGMRDILIHDYLNVDLDLVWKTVKEKIPELNVDIEPILANFKG